MEENRPFVKMPTDGLIVPLGISDGRLVYIDHESEMEKRTHDGRLVGVDFMRPVSREDLEEYRDESHTEDYYEELWKNEVSAGFTKLGLDDYIKERLAEEDTEDEEWYCHRDMVELERLRSCGEDLRNFIDQYVREHEDIDVGTWEWCCHRNLTKPFDVIFNFPEYCKALEAEHLNKQ